MKRLALGVLAATALAFTTPAISGGGKCKESAQACLDHMVAKYKASGWSGFETEKNKETGVVTIKAVHTGTPAADAGFQVGDTLVAINGVKFGKENYEAIKAVKKDIKIGSKVTYTVSRAGAQQELAVTQVAVPEEVLAAWVGPHIIEHATVAQVSP